MTEYRAPVLVEVWLDPFHGCDGQAGAAQERLVNLNRWQVSDLEVEPSIIGPVNGFSLRDLEVVDAPPG